jgi:tetratricopeptide (TPR) repeat protein
VWKWVRRHPATAGLSASIVLGAVLLLALSLWHQVDLQTRLGQALDVEREARQAQEEADARERLGRLRDRVKDLLRAGEGALAVQDWPTARLQLARARDQAAAEPGLADLHARTEHLLEGTARQSRGRERLDRFHRLRNDALFQATLFAGSDLATALNETRAAALEALALFGATPEATAAPAVNSPYYTGAQKADIVSGCYELLMVLAEAVARALPGEPASEARRRAVEALRVLDRAAGLGVTTQAYHRCRAHLLAKAGRTEEAEKEIHRASALRPASALDYFLLGQEQYRQGAWKQAVPAFENVLQRQPDHFWASYYLALCWLRSQRPDQAAARLTACLVQRPDFPWLYLLRASAWSELGHLDRADADFEAALHAPLTTAARYGLLINRGVLRIRQGCLDNALADLRQATALQPGHYQGYVNLAQAYLKGQRTDEAVQQLDEAVRREPRLASLYRTRARVHLLRQDEAAALEDLDQAIRLDADAGLPVVADDHLERGRLLLGRKDYRGALAAGDAVLRGRPRNARAARLRAEALLALDRLPEALDALDDCVKYGPPEAGAFRARATLRARLGQYAAAQNDYARALEIEPDAGTYAARGWCYLVADAAQLALPDFEQALRLDPNLGDAYAGRGSSRVLLRQYRPALSDAGEALSHGPASPRHYYNIARIYVQAGDALDREAWRDHRASAGTQGAWHDRALRVLTRALELQPHPDAARFWKDVIQTDKVLNPLRRSLRFAALAERYGTRQVGTASAP